MNIFEALYTLSIELIFYSKFHENGSFSVLSYNEHYLFLSYRVILSLTQSHTKPHTVREEVILAREGISLKDNSVSPCSWGNCFQEHTVTLLRNHSREHIILGWDNCFLKEQPFKTYFKIPHRFPLHVYTGKRKGIMKRAVCSETLDQIAYFLNDFARMW